MKDHKDYKIIRGIITGDQTIIQDFYQKNFVYISGYILQNSGNKEDAEDIFQDALLLIYQKALSQQLKIQASLRCYFYGVCKNLWRNKLRTNNKIQNDLLTKVIFDTKVYVCTIMQAIEIQDKQAVYNKYFKKLSNDHQKLLQLFFEGKSMREISQITGYSESNTRKIKWKSKNNLYNMMVKDRMYKELITV